MKIKLLILALFSSLTWSFGQSNEAVEPKFITILTEESGKSLMNQCSRKSYKNVKEFWIIDSLNLNNLISNFEQIKFQKTHNKMQVANLDKFGYQLIGIVINSTKFIYLNAFTRMGEDLDNTREKLLENWRSRSIKVCDGGAKFWGILYNTATNEFSELSINGGF